MAMGLPGGARTLAPRVCGTLLALVVWSTPDGAAQPRGVTFTRDVAPILFTHCVSCHRPGEVGGFSLLTFADARPRALAMARATRTRRMPPWKPSRIDGLALVGERRLRDDDIAIIQRWADGGAPEGNPADLPSPPRYADGWRLGTPDLIVTMPAPYTIPPGGPDLLRSFVVPLSLTRGRYVRGLELRPGNARVVHHANIRVDTTRRARALDGVDGAPGFDGRLTGGATFPDGQFLGWTPGQVPPLLEADTAWWLDANSDLVVQLHVRPAERAEPVQVRIGLFFADDAAVAAAARRQPVMVRLGKQNLDIPAGAADYRSVDTYRLPVAVTVLAVQPHAHFRAREVSVSAQLPSGAERALLSIADWDFDWQDQYRFARPITLPAGSVLRMAYRYDNSQANRRNPDRPPRRVRWGQRSDDEMGDVWFQVVAASDADRARLVADVGRKVVAEDAAGYETLLANEPANPRLHEAAAALFLTLGDIPRGVDHLESALRLDPRSAEAHYNLATALAWRGLRDDAVRHLEDAVALDPVHVRAYVNLGALLRASDTATAESHLRRALALDPHNAAAHTNLAGVLVARGDVAAAVSAYRLALAASPTLLEPLTELAWTLATSPTPALRDPVTAVRLAEQARAQTQGTDVRVLDALAAAYAASGRHADAVRTLDDALARIPAAADADETRRLLVQRRALYAAGGTYHDDSRR